VDLALVESMISNELERQKITVDAVRYATYEKAADLMRELVRAPKFIDFLTLPAYQRILKEEKFDAS
jgi:malate synthase